MYALTLVPCEPMGIMCIYIWKRTFGCVIINAYRQIFVVMYRATAIYVAKTFVRNSTSAAGDLTEVDVMLVGTNNGKILKIVMTYNGDDHVPLISEELSVS